MSQDKQNEQLIKIGNWIVPRLDKYESIIVLVFIVGFILKIMTDLKVSILIVLSLTSLAVLYFFKAYSVTDDENAGGLEIFVDKLVSFGGSIATIGILFRLEHWPGYKTMIICGCMTLAILIPIILVLKSKKPDLKIFNQRLLIRVIVLAALGLVLNFTPKEDLV